MTIHSSPRLGDVPRLSKSMVQKLSCCNKFKSNNNNNDKIKIVVNEKINNNNNIVVFDKSQQHNNISFHNTSLVSPFIPLSYWMIQSTSTTHIYKFK